MWGISIPISLFNVLFAIALFVFLMALVQTFAPHLIFRDGRWLRRLAATEAEPLDQREHHRA